MNGDALANPNLTGKIVGAAHGDVVVFKPADRGRELPVPPIELWEGYTTDADKYLEGGRRDVETMLSIIAEVADPTGFSRILDFGCSAGRMLRWLVDGNDRELWGVDIKARFISWCQQHLSPPLLFATTTTAPHLPFEDGYFDLAYAGSVFTHIVDLPMTWLMELRRVLRPGGYGYVTVNDRHTLEVWGERDAGDPSQLPMRQLYDFARVNGLFEKDFAYFSVDYAPGWEGYQVPQVCYDIDYLVSSWQQVVEVVSTTEEAYALQTAVLFRKR